MTRQTLPPEAEVKRLRETIQAIFDRYQQGQCNAAYAMQLVDDALVAEKRATLRSASPQPQGAEEELRP